MLKVGLGAIMPDGREASKPRGGRRVPSANPPSGAKRPSAETLRLQLHLGEKTVESPWRPLLSGPPQPSAVADEILDLLAWRTTAEAVSCSPTPTG